MSEQYHWTGDDDAQGCSGRHDDVGRVAGLLELQAGPGGQGRRRGALHRSAQAAPGGAPGQRAHAKLRPLLAGQVRRLRALAQKNDPHKTSMEINGVINEVLPINVKGESHDFET